MKTHWKKVFDSDYLGSCDLEDGKDLKLVIKSVSVQAVKNSDGKTQDRNVAAFTDPKIKPMILNVTNSKIVKKFAGSSYIEDWKDIPIQVYIKDDIKAFGETTEGLRIRPVQPKMTAPELKPGTQVWDKAVAYIKQGGDITGIKKKYILSADNETLLKKAAE